jgi:polyferredoxin
MSTAPAGRFQAQAASVGQWLATHQKSVRRIQWAVVAGYLLLLAVPAALPLPGNQAFIWNDVTRFAQFVFWGIWWPGVVLATALFGRIWCGLLCPEGFLSETVSGQGRGHALPRWLLWGGWPTTAFVTTTLYGQLTSVYQYPKPALLILGGSTLCAMAIGWFYGRQKRVWCRYLCPASSVFGVLAKIAPLQFEVDPVAWKLSQARRDKPAAVNCAPMLPLRTMKGASGCHMCGRCAGFRGAIRLVLRSPSTEIVEVAGQAPRPQETALILFALAGLVTACFRWSASPLFTSIRLGLAELAAGHGLLDPLVVPFPWWMLTNYRNAAT